MLKILDYAWHQVHLYRLHSLPAEFTLVDLRKDAWNEHQRPRPDNFLGLIPEDEVNTADYDLALLHLDQWCDGNPYRALPFRVMKSLTKDMPQVCIMHGTPDTKKQRFAILQMLGDLPVVCNSYQAAREWDAGEERIDRNGDPQFRTIIHGYKVDEFYNYPLERRRPEVMTICSGGQMSRWYHGTPLLRRLKRDIPLAWYGNPNHGASRHWKRNYTSYRRTLAHMLIYLSPTWRAPMPGARTEAMLSGCCIVSTPGNDWESYIENGVNGYIVRDYIETRDVLRDLIDNPEVAYTVGQRGREFARERFGEARFVADWMKEIGNLLGEK